MNKLPFARSADIVIQGLGKEILIYDLNTHKAYNLNETSSAVYQACDGKTTFDELKRQYKFTDDLIFLALDQLKEDNLIEDPSFVSHLNGVSRREAIRRVGLATMIALPVISSLVAPTAAMAQSTTCRATNESCTGSNFSRGDCCSGNFCFGSICGACVGGGAPFQDCFTETQCDANAVATCCSGSATFTETGCLGPGTGACSCN